MRSRLFVCQQTVPIPGRFATISVTCGRPIIRNGAMVPVPIEVACGACRGNPVAGTAVPIHAEHVAAVVVDTHLEVVRINGFSESEKQHCSGLFDSK
jgi:hypothetical protein